MLSTSGGATLSALERELGAKRVRALYGSIDPDVHFPVHMPIWACDVSYLGTHGADRQAGVDELFSKSRD